MVYNLNLIEHQPLDLHARKIWKDVCARMGYGVGEVCGESVQVADYCDDSGRVVAQKLRYGNPKRFEVRGDASAMGLWNSHRFRNDRGRIVTICEGEIDALALDQAFGGKRPCLSVPNGAPGAKKVVAKNIEMLETYETVVFFFDVCHHQRVLQIRCRRCGKGRCPGMCGSTYSRESQDRFAPHRL